ncbi:MAG TPA: hypothetical protein DDW20_06240 [Firmicutes bacterium]|nr:hypothetical protein [Bacillota bacterium]
MNNTSLIDLQHSILDILIEIKRLCDLHKLKYILYGGSCLGAVRHNGFIPWDDDADIAMPREDYEVFKKICKNGELRSDYYFQDYSKEKEPHYNSPWIRIRKNNTLCVIDYHQKDGFNHLGVFVDIFPIDYLPQNNTQYISRKYSYFKRINRIFSNKIAINHNTLKSKILHLLLIPFSSRYLYLKREESMNSIKQSNTKACMFDFCSSYAPKGALFPADLFEETINHIFEGIEFCIPKKYDEMLKIMYGEYMKLPPKEKRVAHLPKIISL